MQNSETRHSGGDGDDNEKKTDQLDLADDAGRQQ